MEQQQTTNRIPLDSDVVQREESCNVDITIAYNVAVVICDDANSDSTVHGIQQSWESRERFCTLLFNRATNARGPVRAADPATHSRRLNVDGSLGLVDQVDEGVDGMVWAEKRGQSEVLALHRHWGERCLVRLRLVVKRRISVLSLH